MLLVWNTAAEETSTLRLSKGAAYGAQASFDRLKMPGRESPNNM
jgi:hypothetical protein